MPLLKTVNFRTTVLSTSLLALLTASLSLFSLCFGPTFITPGEVSAVLLHAAGLTGGPVSEVNTMVLVQIRLPRVLLACLAGGGLSIAGVVFQVLLRNVLADPYILGISGGASIGALVAVATGAATMFLGAGSLFAFAGSFLVVTFLYALGRVRGVMESRNLLLAGVMLGAFLSAIILILVSLIGDPARNALFWLLGNLGYQSGTDLYVVAPVIIICTTMIILLAGKFNLLALGDEVAFHLGVHVDRVKKSSYLLASLLTGVVVSVSGAIGFVGFVVPHATRLLFGADHRILLPTSFLTGACFLLFSDFIARQLLYPTELPVGAVTAAIGAPVFIILMRISD